GIFAGGRSSPGSCPRMREKVNNRAARAAVSYRRAGPPNRSQGMATAPTHPVLRYIRHLAAARPMATDRPLFSRFAGQWDETAFEALVRRHGPLVLGVCRRVLRDAHAAEDAFQTTFLVLARKAGSLRRPEALGPWLYGVALRTARKARARE